MRKNVEGLSRFFRFLTVGLVNSVASFVLFLVYFSAIGFHYLLANILVFVSWVWVGYELQRRFAFQAKRTAGGFARFVVNQIGFMTIGTLLLWVLVELVRLLPEIAYLLTLGIITGGLYLSSRFWVFRRLK